MKDEQDIRNRLKEEGCPEEAIEGVLRYDTTSVYVALWQLGLDFSRENPYVKSKDVIQYTVSVVRDKIYTSSRR